MIAARNNVYVEAARVSGCTDTRIVLVHILPNILAPTIVLCTLGVAAAILVGASLSFLGLGAQPPTPEWGAMLNAGLPVDARGQHNATPLHWAAYHGNREMVKVLLPFGPPLEATDADFSGTPLDWALYCKQPEIAEELRSRGAPGSSGA